MEDTETRKRGDQTGLDTLVVHAVNDGYLLLEVGYRDWEYARKSETQRN